MCGIYGELDANAAPEARRRFAASAGRALDHRGPDGSGVWSDERCLLGHTRLSIIDLTDHAAQPMESVSRSSVMAFNGEIYNFIEVRERMAPPEGGWRSRSDTEVLLEALDRHGVQAIDDTIGMFAIALWRPAQGELWLIRDRLGKKPLYFARTASGGLRFASEFGALLADGTIDRATSVDRLAEYLQHGYVGAPRTGLASVQVVPPGCWLRARVDERGVTVEMARYWDLPDPDDVAPCAAAWREQFQATLRDAVRIRLRSDVPVGAFLSGGVDSSVVSLLAAEHGPLRTFMVDFAEAEFSEGRYADEVARHIGSEHTRLRVGREALASLPGLVSIYGDLHGDPSAIPTVALCREARKHVKVVLTGDGGDELLGGYTRYASTLKQVALAARLPRALPLAARLFGRRLLPWWMRGAGRLGQFSADLAESYTREVAFYSPHGWPVVLRRPGGEGCPLWPDVVRQALDGRRPPLLRLMACDMATYLPEDILVKVDRASMACGLEVRAPLLDHRLIELALRAQPSFIADAFGGKLPLRALYAKRLPRAVFTRPKMGFGVPLGHWFRGEISSFAAERLLDPGACVAPLLEHATVERLISNHRRGLFSGSARLWHLLVLHQWFEQWRPRVASAAADLAAA